MTLLGDFIPGLPEIFMAFAGLVLLLWGVFAPKAAKHMPEAVMGTFLLTMLLILCLPTDQEQMAFYGLFLSSGYTQFAKLLLLGSCFAVFLMSYDQLHKEDVTDYEYGLLMLFSTLGMMVMVSANDLIALFVGLELQSLPLYVMIAMQKDRPLASEASLKYFILGSLATAFILYGSSLVYGYTGTTQYAGLAQALSTQEEVVAPFLYVGLVFLGLGLAFKMSLAPLHMWTPDVYQGSPTPVTAFLAAAPKAAAVFLLVRVLHEIFSDQMIVWQTLLMGLSVLSMLFGAFGALYQTDIKRLLAYSSIAHMGFITLGLVSGTFGGVKSIFVYAAIYLVMVIGAFACVLSLRRHGKLIEKIDDLAGLSKEMPLVASAFTVSLFSMAGIPPLAGFMAKLSVFLSVVEAGFYLLAVVGVVASVITAAYYLKVVKVMYFDPSPSAQDGMTLDPRQSKPTTLIMVTALLLMVTYLFYPDVLMEPAHRAAQALFYRT
ncbi:MAG: NADH-quinone oxidoreductase subunit NuoN [Alphaproteobacteria bacterium]|nr:NADH-quinone oxidoreductase subunit NuoN [Alphaproteobacteria bacterium]